LQNTFKVKVAVMQPAPTAVPLALNIDL
jgi:hypothetical protein